MGERTNQSVVICLWPTCNYSAVSGDYCYQHGRIYGEKKEKPKAAPIAQVSDRRKKENAQYLKLKAEYMAANPKCEVEGCKKKGNELHHRAGRIGSNLTDPSTFMSVCSEHHRRITDDSKWAMENGYSLSRLQQK